MAQIIGGVRITGFISPTDTSDTYPVIDPVYGIDGIRNYSGGTSELNSIPTLRRRAGMIVGINNGAQYYKLKPSPWNLDINDWEQVIYVTGVTFDQGNYNLNIITNNGTSTQSLSILAGDLRVTGGTYNSSNGVVTFVNNSGGTFGVSGFTQNYTNDTITGGTYSTGTVFNGGNIQFRSTLPANNFSVTGLTDTLVTGGTYSAGTIFSGNSIQFRNNSGGTFSVFGVRDTFVTGGTYSSSTTVNGGLIQLIDNSGAILNVTGITDTFITGGTYSAGAGFSGNSIQFTNNSGSSFTVSSIQNIFVTGGTYSASNTFSGNSIQFTNNSGSSFTVSGLRDTVITGGTYSAGTTFSGNSIQFTNNSGGTFNVTGLSDIYVTGGTYSANTISLRNNSGVAFSVTGLSDTFFTAGTYNRNTSEIVFSANTGGTLTVTGITDTFFTAGTYSSINGTITFSANTGGTLTVSGLTGMSVSVSANTGLGVNNGNILYTIYNTTVGDGLTNVAVGSLPAGTPASTWKTRTIVEVLDAILFPDVNPTYTIPTIAINGITTQDYEVGRLLSFTANAAATKNDAGEFVALRFFRNGSQRYLSDSNGTETTDIANQFGYPNNNNPNYIYSFVSPFAENYTIPTPTGGNTSTTTTYNVNGDYNDGVPKQNNKGVYDSRTPAVRSTDAPQRGTINFSSSIVTITGLYPIYYGTGTTRFTATDVVNQIQAGTASSILASASDTISVTVGRDLKYMWVAHFANYADKNVWFFNQNSSGSIASDSLILPPVTQAVNSPNGYWSGVQFKIYLSSYDTQPAESVLQLRNS